MKHSQNRFMTLVVLCFMFAMNGIAQEYEVSITPKITGGNCTGDITVMIASLSYLFVITLQPHGVAGASTCLLYTSPSPRDGLLSRMPSSA